MKHILKLLVIFNLLIVAQQAHAQLEVQLEPIRQEYMLGEEIPMKLTLSNTSDQSVILSNKEQRKWLHFTVTNSNSPEGVKAVSSPSFPNVTLSPGSARSFELNIRPYFHFSREGTYKVIATVRMPDGVSTHSSHRASFMLSPGSTIRKFNIVHKGKKLELHCKLLRVNQYDCLYGQVIDANSRIAIGACYMGRYLNFMEPRIIIDGKQQLHMLCQSTPQYYTYSIMNTQGERTGYQLYRRTDGPINLIVSGGGVSVTGAVPHVKADKADGFNNVHSATDRIE